MLCVRFKRPTKAELGEPIKPGIHLFTDKDTDEITAIEIIDSIEDLKKSLNNANKKPPPAE